jgi:hypothetical protein
MAAHDSCQAPIGGEIGELAGGDQEHPRERERNRRWLEQMTTESVGVEGRKRRNEQLVAQVRQGSLSRVAHIANV